MIIKEKLVTSKTPVFWEVKRIKTGCEFKQKLKSKNHNLHFHHGEIFAGHEIWSVKKGNPDIGYEDLGEYIFMGSASGNATDEYKDFFKGKFYEVLGMNSSFNPNK